MPKKACPRRRVGGSLVPSKVYKGKKGGYYVIRKSKKTGRTYKVYCKKPGATTGRRHGLHRAIRRRRRY